MVLLRADERLGRLDLGHDLPAVEAALRRKLSDEGLRLSQLPITNGVQARTVLRAVIGALAIELGRIVHLKETLQQLLVGDLRRIKHHFHRFGVRAVALRTLRRRRAILAADFLVVRLRARTLHVAALGADDARSLLKVVLDAPEATAGEIRGFAGDRRRLGSARLVLGVELQRGAVEAEAQSRRLRAVVKHMAKMRGAARAIDLDALHAVRVVFMSQHMLDVEGLEEARPTRARVELVRAGEQRQSANDAAVGAVLVVVEQRAAERSLSARLLRNPISLGIEFLGEFLDARA